MLIQPICFVLYRQSILPLRQRASPTVTTRITIDSAWSATQMQSCLVLFFSRWFVKPAGQKLFFTFLQVCEAYFHLLNIDATDCR